jgi:hypothetical protein
MISALAILNVIMLVINLCAAVMSVIFAIQSSIVMRRIERQSRELRKTSR